MNIFSKKEKRGRPKKLEVGQSDNNNVNDSESINNISENSDNIVVNDIDEKELQQRENDLLHRLGKSTEQSEKVNEEAKEDIFSRIKNDINEGKKEDKVIETNSDNENSQHQQKQQETAKGLIDGYLLIMATDMIVPMLFVFVLGKRKKFKAEQIALTEHQKNSLKPIADIVARDIAIQSPATAYIILVSISYGFNIMALKTE